MYCCYSTNFGVSDDALEVEMEVEEGQIGHVCLVVSIVGSNHMISGFSFRNKGSCTCILDFRS